MTGLEVFSLYSCKCLILVMSFSDNVKHVIFRFVYFCVRFCFCCLEIRLFTPKHYARTALC